MTSAQAEIDEIRELEEEIRMLRTKSDMLDKWVPEEEKIAPPMQRREPEEPVAGTGSMGAAISAAARKSIAQASLQLGRFGKLTARTEKDGWRQEVDTSQADGDVALSEDTFTATLLMYFTIHRAEDAESKAVMRNAMVKRSITWMICISAVTLLMQIGVIEALYQNSKYCGWEPSDSMHLSWSKIVALILLSILIGKDIADIMLLYLLGTAANRKQIISYTVHAVNTATQIFRFLTNCGCWFASWLVIQQSDNIVDVWKDCCALAFVVDMDAFVFAAVKAGLFGRRLMLTMNSLAFEVDFGVIGHGTKLIGRYGEYKFYAAMYITWFLTAVSIITMLLVEVDPELVKAACVPPPANWTDVKATGTVMYKEMRRNNMTLKNLTR